MSPSTRRGLGPPKTFCHLPFLLGAFEDPANSTGTVKGALRFRRVSSKCYEPSSSVRLSLGFSIFSRSLSPLSCCPRCLLGVTAGCHSVSTKKRSVGRDFRWRSLGSPVWGERIGRGLSAATPPTNRSQFCAAAVRDECYFSSRATQPEGDPSPHTRGPPSWSAVHPPRPRSAELEQVAWMGLQTYHPDGRTEARSRGGSPFPWNWYPTPALAFPP